jgi:multicomponent Na+:H+ antiporter subunit D
VSLSGVGGVALEAVEVHAFAILISFTALQMALGGVLERRGATSLTALRGAGRAMPLSAFLLLLAGLACAGAPGFAGYASLSAAIENVAQWQHRWLWLLFLVLAAWLFVVLALRPTLALFAPQAREPVRDAPYGMALGTALALFFCMAIGLAPQWLYDLTPGELTLAPFAPDRIARQLSLFGAAGLAYIVLRTLGADRRRQAVEIYDVDALYRGPVANAGRWIGALGLRVLSALARGVDLAGAGAVSLADRWLRSLDRPYADGRGVWTLVTAAALTAAAVLALALP